MSICTLVIGEAGSGKSTSLRNLEPKETFIINVLNKPLPFRGMSKNYTQISSDRKTGNYYSTDNCSNILGCIDVINNSRPDIKNFIIDDFQYVMSNEFMRRGMEKSFDKFTEIGMHAWQILTKIRKCRNDLFCFVLSHSETDNAGKVKCKTIGKLLNEKVTLEGMFDITLHTQLIDDEYKFLTRGDGIHLARASMGMFEDKYIDNDLNLAKNYITEYIRGE